MENHQVLADCFVVKLFKMIVISYGIAKNNVLKIIIIQQIQSRATGTPKEKVGSGAMEE
jgi:hypothetical protein